MVKDSSSNRLAMKCCILIITNELLITFNTRNIVPPALGQAENYIQMKDHPMF